MHNNLNKSKDTNKSIRKKYNLEILDNEKSLETVSFISKPPKKITKSKK